MPIYYPYYDSTYFIYVLIPLMISIWASIRVKTTFGKYSEYTNSRSLTASQVTRMILDKNGQSDVSVERVGGELTDHYDPRTNTIRLSESVYNSTSVAAIGVAAHEAGHAAQHAAGYFPIKIRNALVPVANFSSYIAVPMVILGAILEFGGLIDLAIILYSAVVLFSLVTLPVEFNASRRAIKTLDEYGILTAQENEGAKKVLSAAAMTYIASTLAALGSFLRILALFGRRRD